MDLDDKLTEGNRMPARGLKAWNIESKRPFQSLRPSHEPIKPQAVTEIIGSNDTERY
jgi:hypothetical protein